MKNIAWILSFPVLLLAAVLMTGEVSFAQPQGGPGRGGAAQGAGPGWRTGNPYCPNYSAVHNCPRYGAGNAQTRSRKRFRQNVCQTSPQSNPQNPSTQSGN